MPNGHQEHDSKLNEYSSRHSVWTPHLISSEFWSQDETTVIKDCLLGAGAGELAAGQVPLGGGIPGGHTLGGADVVEVIKVIPGGAPEVFVVVHVVDIGVLGVGGEVVGDLVIPRTARGGVEGSTELGEHESLQDHPSCTTSPYVSISLTTIHGRLLQVGYEN